jgi:hypothetical protein
MKNRCEGYRRYGGAFSFGPVTWEQCTREAVVMLTIIQKGKEETLPACVICWAECLNNGIEIVKAYPISELLA